MAEKPKGMEKQSAFENFSSDDLLKGNRWKGQVMPDEFLAAIKEEAATFKSSQLWKVLKAEAQWFAIKSLLEKGESGDDIRFARAIGNVVQVFDEKLEQLSK